MRPSGALSATLVGLVAGVAHGADPKLFSPAALPGLEPSWGWVGGAAAFGLIAGFALGWRTLARRIRKKYGGLKIY